MNWTKTPPTKPGAYWWRASEKDSFHELTEVYFSDDTLCALSVDDAARGCDAIAVTGTAGEWCGPLVPVEEVEKAYREGWRDCLFSDTIIDGNYATSRARKIVEGEI